MIFPFSSGFSYGPRGHQAPRPHDTNGGTGGGHRRGNGDPWRRHVIQHHLQQRKQTASLIPFYSGDFTCREYWDYWFSFHSTSQKSLCWIMHYSHAGSIIHELITNQQRFWTLLTCLSRTRAFGVVLLRRFPRDFLQTGPINGIFPGRFHEIHICIYR